MANRYQARYSNKRQAWAVWDWRERRFITDAVGKLMTYTRADAEWVADQGNQFEILQPTVKEV